MFSVEMQTKVGEMSVEELQELEIHINGSKRADLSESSASPPVINPGSSCATSGTASLL